MRSNLNKASSLIWAFGLISQPWLLAEAHAQAAYAPGFIWQRSTDFKRVPYLNPTPDQLGTPVWSAEYVTASGDDFAIDGSTPWYRLAATRLGFLDTSWFGNSQVVWSYANDTNPSCWAGAGTAMADFDMQQQTTSNGSGGSVSRVPLIRWTNPTNQRVDLALQAVVQPAIYWLGTADAPVDFVIAVRHIATSDSAEWWTVVYQQAGVSRPAGPSGVYRVLAPLNGFAVLFPGDQLVVSIRAHRASSQSGFGACGGGIVMPLVWSPDTDGDGILDLWETPECGIDGDGDGQIDMDLAAKGATATRPDLFVEIDSMSGFSPKKTAIAAVQEAFVLSPRNIHAQFEIDDTAIPADSFSTGFVWDHVAAIKELYFGTTDERHGDNRAGILAAKRLVYRYALFGSHFSDEPGLMGEAPNFVASDFVVTLANAPSRVRGGTSDEQAATFMHELGHALGLSHGGLTSEADSEFNMKPNYYSVMNYLWTLPQPWNINGATRRLDYSRSAFGTLHEAALDERDGLMVPDGADVPRNLRIPYQSSTGGWEWAYAIPGTIVDWNGNGNYTDTLSASINDICPEITGTPRITELTGFDDWNHVELNFRKGGYFLNGDTLSLMAQCITREAMLSIAQISPPPVCVADLNHDGQVDDGDFSIFLLQYNILDCFDSHMPPDCPTDFDYNGMVDDDDFVVFVVAYNQLLCP